MLLFSDSCDAYRFEIGGGHWIFGADAEILHFLDKFAKTKSYFRRSSVFFPDKQLYIPYPIQNNLRFLIKPIINLALEEVSRKSTKPQLTMKDWLLGNFGETLCELFFFPFHKLYTANLYERIAPQDTFKSPVNIELVRQGASFKVSPVGYNVKFVYPISGLGKLIFGLANKCHIRYNKKASKIDVKNKMVYFKDGSSVNYKKLISTLPLNKLGRN